MTVPLAYSSFSYSLTGGSWKPVLGLVSSSFLTVVVSYTTTNYSFSSFFGGIWKPVLGVFSSFYSPPVITVPLLD